MMFKKKLLSSRRRIPIKNDSLMFKELQYGTLFIFKYYDKSRVYCKTPMADMRQYNNRENMDGAFCNAVCVNPARTEEYIQAPLDAACIVVDAVEMFGKAVKD